MKWSTKTGHRIKALNCHNEVSNDKGNENETDVEVSAVAGSVSDRQCQQALLDATPNAGILVNNNGGPP